MFSCKQVPVLALALLAVLLCGGTGVALGAAPVVKAISPNNGSVTGGTQVTIAGEGFIAGSTVKFSASSGSGVTIESSKQIKVTSPVGTGLVGITVTNANGTSATTPSDQFGYDAAPTAVWLGLNGNNTTYLGSVPYWAEREVVYDRGGPIEFTAGELPTGGVETDVEDGMIPVVVIEYEGYDGQFKSDPAFPQKRSAKEEAEGKDTIKEYVHGFVKTAAAVLEEAANKDPEAPVLLEPMNEPWGYTTPQYNGAEYAEVIAELLPEAQKAGIPLSDIYVGATGKKWVSKMYEGQAKLRSEIQGWYLHPYGPASGTFEENSEGIQSLPYVQAEMTSGQNNLIVSEVGYCAKDINEGKGCNGTEESAIAASNLSKMLGNAKPYHEAGWLKALLVYSRNAGGWAMQYNGGELTAQGKALEAFAKAQVGWSVMATANPKEATGTLRLSGVSCSSEKACMAVGYYTPKGAQEAGFGEEWNGAKWTLQTSFVPSEAKFSEASGVSCSSSTSCVVVGKDLIPAIFPWASHWDGIKWQPKPVVKPPESEDDQFDGVSCTSPTVCMAVGSYISIHGELVATGLTESWNGTEWIQQPTLGPQGKLPLLAHFTGVSCVSSAYCIAVGTHQLKIVTASWGGKEWQVQFTPHQPEEVDSELLGISCVSSSVCTAVGRYESAGIYRTLAERWNCAEWQIEPSPSPLWAEESRLTGVSCTSALACTAVGYERNRMGTDVTLVEVWNGEEWAIQPSPNPLGTKASSLFGVSCTSLSKCVAVGESENGSSEWSTLAEANF